MYTTIPFTMKHLLLPLLIVMTCISCSNNDVKSGQSEIADSTITPIVSKDLSKGKALFYSSCASCHSITKQLTGPPLFGTMSRWHYDTATVIKFIQNPARVIKNSAHAACIFDEYYKIVMPPFPQLAREDCIEIFKYVDDEGIKALGELPAALSKSNCDNLEKR